MTLEELRAVAASLAASLAVIHELLDDVADGSDFARDACRDALDAAASALEGMPLGPLVPAPESDPATWPAWTDEPVWSPDPMPGDSGVLIATPARLAAI